jgi:hypothetical protein
MTYLITHMRKNMSMIIFDGSSFEGEKVAIRAGAIVGVVSDQTEDGSFRTVILFRSGDTDHRAAVKHSVPEIVEAINKVSEFF